jgi:hypothetical protein
MLQATNAQAAAIQEPQGVQAGSRHALLGVFHHSPTPSLSGVLTGGLPRHAIRLVPALPSRRRCFRVHGHLWIHVRRRNCRPRIRDRLRLALDTWIDARRRNRCRLSLRGLWSCRLWWLRRWHDIGGKHGSRRGGVDGCRGNEWTQPHEDFWTHASPYVAVAVCAYRCPVNGRRLLHGLRPVRTAPRGFHRAAHGG